MSALSMRIRALTELRRFEHFWEAKYLSLLDPTPEGRHLYGRLMSSENLLSSLLIPIERLRGKVSHCRVILLVQQFRGEPRDEPEHSFARQTCMRSIRQNREP